MATSLETAGEPHRVVLMHAPPRFDRQGTELVSRRVRNFRYLPAFGALIDQLWVR